MPNPRPKETLHSFVSRFMGSSEAQSDFPKQSQRAAVAFSKFRKRKRKRG